MSDTATAPEPAAERLSRVFKALADPVRLQMVGLLVGRARCGRELAGELDLAPPTISHHLKVLRGAGLLRETRQTPYRFYELDLAPARAALREIGDRRRAQRLKGPGLPEAQRRVLRSFFEGTRLVSIPAQRRKREVVLEEVLRRLPRRRSYGERELSRFLQAIHPDVAALRRDLVEAGYLQRERGVYRVAERGRAVLAAARGRSSR